MINIMLNPNTTCVICKKKFYRRPSYKKKSKNKYYTCSHKCYREVERQVLFPEAWNTCDTCGKEYRTNPAYVRRRPKQQRNFCSRKCFNSYTDNYCSWFEDVAGYMCTREKGVLTRVHRLIAFDGKPVKGFEVHHIDGNKKNNSKSNLKILTREQHMKIHSAMAERNGYFTNCEICKTPKYLNKSYVKSKYNNNLSKIKKYRCQKCYYKYGKLSYPSSFTST